MHIWKGTTNTYVRSLNPTSLDQWMSFIITNVSSNSAFINILVDDVHVCPKSGILLAGKTLEVRGISYPKNATFKVTTTELMDYYLTCYSPAERDDSTVVNVALTNNVTGGGGSGDSANIINTYQAGADLGGNRLVVLLADQLFYFDPTDESHYDYVIGFTAAAGLTGEDIEVVSYGPLTGFALVAGSVYYADLNGQVTDSIPTSGISLKVGTAVDTSILFINLYQPIIKI